MFLSVVVFALAYMIKGGWFSLRFPKLISAAIIFDFILLTTHDLMFSIILSAVWILAVSPSMGEEAGSVGRWKKWWGDYKDAYSQERDNFIFDRSYGVKKWLQRGVWTGAIFSIALGNPALFVPVLGLGFVACHYTMQEVYYRIHRTDSWAYAEPAYGALIGLCYSISMGV